VADQTPNRQTYRAVIISPHLDDAVFSCGGWMTQLLREGPVLVLNVFTGYLGDLKIHGAVLGEERYLEEAAAATFMGFESRSLGELDAPFRRQAYRQLGNIFRPPVAQDLHWLPSLRQRIFGELGKIDFQQLLVPLGVGWHVDHVVTHMLFDTWADAAKLLYYEDASYCCIPHATRYRLNDIATYAVSPGDLSLLPINETQAWWQAAKAYANTALMKNLQPWILRKAAAPATSFYLYRLMGQHKRQSALTKKSNLMANTVVLDPADIANKIDAMLIYASQFREFFESREDCEDTLASYCRRCRPDGIGAERYWALGGSH
jgi:LmbE family N-acetylglucosaminyl deacetylase